MRLTKLIFIMDQIEKPLSIAYCGSNCLRFYVHRCRDGFNSIENNTTSGYTSIENKQQLVTIEPLLLQ